MAPPVVFEFVIFSPFPVLSCVCVDMLSAASVLTRGMRGAWVLQIGVFFGVCSDQ